MQRLWNITEESEHQGRETKAPSSFTSSTSPLYLSPPNHRHFYRIFFTSLPFRLPFFQLPFPSRSSLSSLPFLHPLIQICPFHLSLQCFPLLFLAKSLIPPFLFKCPILTRFPLHRSLFLYSTFLPFQLYLSIFSCFSPFLHSPTLLYYTSFALIFHHTCLSHPFCKHRLEISLSRAHHPQLGTHISDF